LSSCRDGLSELPHPSKKRASITAKKVKTEHSVALSDAKPVPPKIKMTTARKTTDRKLNDLQTLHERTNVTGNLKLSESHRLKVDSPDQLKRKRKPLPGFKLELADLNDPHPSNTISYELNDIDADDDDDLPEAHDITKAIGPSITEQIPSSDTNYSNSDIDSLIRAVPLDEIKYRDFKASHDIPFKNKASKKYSGKHGTLASNSETPMKRARLTGAISPPAKRVRYANSNSDSPSRASSRHDKVWPLVLRFQDFLTTGG
jgi:hypothetical protein